MSRTRKPTNKPENRKRGSRGKGRDKVDAAEFWAVAPQLPAPEPITVATDPTMVLRSLGDLPLQDRGQRVSHEIHRVLVRSSLLAGALAELAGLLDTPPDA